MVNANVDTLLDRAQAERQELIPILSSVSDTVCCNQNNDDTNAQSDGDSDIFEMTVDKDDDCRNLEATFTLTSTVLFAVGQTIGSGIFVSPNEVIKHVGSPGMALIIWVASGVISLTGALSFSELGTMFKRSGGEFQYIKAAYGELWAFVYMWVCGVIRNSLGCAVIALTFSSYLIGTVISTDYEYYEVVHKAVAGIGIMFIIMINMYSTKMGVVLCNFFCILKLLALSFLIVLGAWKLLDGETENIRHGFHDTNMNVGEWTTAFFAALWSYSGWNCINMISGEIKNSSKNVPRALVISQIVLITIYGLANIAYCSILSTDDLVNHDAIALFVGRQMLKRFGEGWARFGEIFFGLSVAISSYGSLNSSLMCSCRLPFIAAQENMFPKFIALIQCRTGTPIVSLLYMGLASFICVWPSDISSLISYVGFLSWFWWGLCFLSVIVLRFKMPLVPRRFKVFWGIPVIAVASTAYLVIGPFFVNPIPCFGWIAITAIGIPIYYGYVDTKNTCHRMMNLILLRFAEFFRASL